MAGDRRRFRYRDDGQSTRRYRIWCQGVSAAQAIDSGPARGTSSIRSTRELAVTTCSIWDDVAAASRHGPVRHEKLLLTLASKIRHPSSLTSQATLGHTGATQTGFEDVP